MLAKGLRGISYAKYQNLAGVESYTGGRAMGKSVSMDISPEISVADFYDEDVLDESVQEFVGGSVTIGVKGLDYTTQADLFGHTQTPAGTEPATPAELLANKDDVSNPVGVAFYAPVQDDGVTKFRAIMLFKVKFSTPTLSFKTKEKTIVFSTPTTVGSLMTNAGGDWKDEALCLTEAEAIAWVKESLSIA